ncbi:MAG: amidohydrolase family protein [Candidatus Moranbacteria bacterium]|nr:amidohydrolase family protein [Candidatus Moranbacteria bacterium]
MSRSNYLIKKANIIDGTGKKSYPGDILIVDDKIKKIGDLKEKGNFNVIDAENMWVCPGFIDINNHSDSYWTLFKYPSQESLLYQGITAIIGGNCGSSLAPVIRNQAIDSIRKYVDTSETLFYWDDFSSYYDFLKERRLSLNFGSLVGHNTIRRSLIGNKIRQLDSKELDQLKKILDQSMQSGALGLSTGLVYSHAQIASKKELIELAKIVKKYNGVYATHIRSEGENLISSIKEAISIAKTTGVNLEISHLKACGKDSWPLMDQVLEMIERARCEQININFDVYPYTQAGPVLYTLLPGWVVEGGKQNLMKRLRDPVIRKKIIDEMKQADFDYGQIMISVSKIPYALPRNKISQIAKNQERSSEEVVIDLILSADDTITTMIELMNKKNVEKALAQAPAIVSTNGAGYSKEHKKTGDLVHPRCFAGVTKFLKTMIMEGKLLPIEQAVNKLTGLPAQKYGLIKEIGTIEKNKKADLLILDSKKLSYKSNKLDPFHYSCGIKDLLINGKPVIVDYELTQERAGRVIKI